ncbi:MAG TPA: protein-export chaperone SecB [Acetobacteraceae bacterium]|jgi:preprotein translocase subunit SecB|nr:protein-export chaperone SecB [Acetobacteraceae bacterium]
MSETTTTGAPVTTLPLTVNLQYIKDLSFEVPGGPQIFTQLRTSPQVNINMDVQARRLQEGQQVFEVALLVRAEANLPPGGNGQEAAAKQPIFIAELTYAGVFTLGAIPDNAVEPVLLVECPRLLFPFARNIVSDITRDGGFPPVLLAPIDFVALWQSRRSQITPSPALA